MSTCRPRRPGEIAIVNCLWIYNSLRFWKLQAPGAHAFGLHMHMLHTITFFLALDMGMDLCLTKEFCMMAAEGYLGNPDPEANPARGQPAFKSLPAHMAEVPNSEDEDCIMQTEAIPARERQDAAPPGADLSACMPCHPGCLVPYCMLGCLHPTSLGSRGFLAIIPKQIRQIFAQGLCQLSRTTEPRQAHLQELLRSR